MQLDASGNSGLCVCMASGEPYDEILAMSNTDNTDQCNRATYGIDSSMINNDSCLRRRATAPS